MTRHHSVLDLGGPGSDRNHLTDDAAPGWRTYGLGAAHRPVGPQLPEQAAVDRPRAAWIVQREVDRLVGNPHPRSVRELAAHPSGNLLRRPTRGKLRLDDLAQILAFGELGGFGPARSLVGRGVGCRRAIATAAAVSRDLPRHGRGRSPQLPGQLTGRQAGRDASRYLLPLCGSQMPNRAPLWLPTHAAALREEPAHVLHRCTETSGNEAERLALTPPLPNLVLPSNREPVVTHPCLHDLHDRPRVVR